MESNNPAIQALTYALLTPENVLNDIPVVTDANLNMRGLRLLPEGIPDDFTGWTKLDKVPATFNADFKDYEESAALIRQLISVDRRTRQQKGWIGDPVKNRVAAWKRLLIPELNETFVYNSGTGPDGEPDAWIGLDERIANRDKYKTPAENFIDAGGLLFTRSMTRDNALDFWEYLNEGLARVGAPDGDGCVIYVNFALQGRINRAAMLGGEGGGFGSTRDAFDRQVTTYRNARFRDLGFMKDSTTPIIGNAESATGVRGGGDRCSIRIVHYGDEWMRGWQTNALMPEYLGRSTENGVIERFLIDWAVGLFQPHPQSVARIYNLEFS
jgi:hypothetical protein